MKVNLKPFMTFAHNIPLKHVLLSRTPTDVKGVQHVTRALGVVPAAPDVDGLVHQHGRVSVAHVGHFPSVFPSSGPHGRQLRPAQRHWEDRRREWDASSQSSRIGQTRLALHSSYSFDRWN